MKRDTLGKKEILLIKERFTGAWRLAGYALNQPDGKVTYPYGEETAGLLMYDAQGHMSVQIMKPGVARFSIDDRWMGTPEEVKAAFDAYIAYYGQYTVDEEAKTVTHHVDGSVFPNYVGKKLVRMFELSADCLILSTPPMSFGGAAATARLTWLRL